MAEEVKKKSNFFKDLIKSIKDLDKYEDFALEEPSKSFKYILKLVLLLAIIIAVVNTYKGISNTKKIYVDLKEILPDFSYSEGILAVDSEEPIIIKNYEDTIGTIAIDTNADSDKIKKYEEDRNIDILFLSDRFTLLNIGQVSYRYSDFLSSYDIKEFTKQEAVDYIDNLNIISLFTSIYVMLFIYIFILYFIKIIIDVLLLALIAYFISILARVKIKFAPAFNIAIHSITLPVLLNLIYIVVNVLTGFEIKYFNVMYYTISYIYVVVAILMIKTDFINRQMELMKIIQEQEKIKNETEEKQEDEEEEKKNDEEKEKKKDKNEEEEPKDLGTDTPV